VQDRREAIAVARQLDSAAGVGAGVDEHERCFRCQRPHRVPEWRRAARVKHIDVRPGREIVRNRRPSVCRPVEHLQRRTRKRFGPCLRRYPERAEYLQGTRSPVAQVVPGPRPLALRDVVDDGNARFRNDRSAVVVEIRPEDQVVAIARHDHTGVTLLVSRQFLHAPILADSRSDDNQAVPITDAVALLLGLGIAIVVAVLARGIGESSDASMRWEGGVAVGFTAVIFLGPFWIAQAVLTVIATSSPGGVAPGWLWAWLFLAPAAGASPPAVGLVRLLKRSSPRPSRGSD
jgi:hypothetical protein